VSFTAVLFYALTNAFLGYADSLANQPIDDLLRFAFMLAVVLSTRAETELLRKRWAVAAWFIEFALSLVSFDSVFFLYVWLIGWDVLERRGFRWKTYLLYGMAPTAAHGLQFLQNVWYLGWADAVIDIKDAFLLKHGADQGYNVGHGRLSVLATSVAILFQNLFNPAALLGIAFVAYCIHRVLLDRESRELPSIGLLIVLFLSGLSFVLILPHAARMPYEARQMLPVAALLIGGFTWSVPTLFKRAMHPQGEGPSAPNLWLAAPYLLIALLLVMISWFRLVFSDRTPVYELGPRKEEMQFAQALGQLKTPHAPVFFDIGAFTIYWDPNYVPGYPQILPLTEYYAGSSPILCFRDIERTAEDIARMVRKSTVRFSPVVVTDNPAAFESLYPLLERQGVLRSQPPNSISAMGRHAVDLTDYIAWEKK
jgi:hydrogenase/urease accessory protein HupE